MRMRFELDNAGKGLSIRLRSGDVAREVALDDTARLQLDAAGRPVALAFADADDFAPFLRRHKLVEIPSRVRFAGDLRIEPV